MHVPRSHLELYSSLSLFRACYAKKHSICILKEFVALRGCPPSTVT